MTDGTASNYLNFITATTEEIKRLVHDEAYAYKIFVFADITVPCVGISLPIILPTTGQSGCMQICSGFNGLDDVFVRKFLDGVWYGEW